MRTALLALLTVSLVTAVGAQTPTPALQWGPAPPFFPAGARFTVLQGDPGQAGVYTVRLEMPAGYTIRPHFHPTDELVTVVSGSLLLGMGDSVNTQTAQLLPAGGFINAKAQAHHFAVARGKTVVQVHGMGPFAITYINPKDDPRNAPRP
jgi:quercetin dioxygenase-like cupin family protein